MTNIDSRSPQEKGKPAHTTLHGQIGRPRSAGRSIEPPNRSGRVKMTLGKKQNAGYDHKPTGEKMGNGGL